jgi:hypothetical protein
MKKILSLSLLALGFISCGKSSKSAGPVVYGKIVEHRPDAGHLNVEVVKLSIEQISSDAGGTNPWLLNSQIQSEFGQMTAIMQPPGDAKPTNAQIAKARALANQLKASLATMTGMLNHGQATAWFQAANQQLFFIDKEIISILVRTLDEIITPAFALAEQDNAGTITPQDLQAQGEALEKKSNELGADISSRQNLLLSYMPIER